MVKVALQLGVSSITKRGKVQCCFLSVLLWVLADCGCWCLFSSLCEACHQAVVSWKEDDLSRVYWKNCVVAEVALLAQVPLLVVVRWGSRPGNKMWILLVPRVI